jgi:hypothetical protein
LENELALLPATGQRASDGGWLKNGWRRLGFHAARLAGQLQQAALGIAHGSAQQVETGTCRQTTRGTQRVTQHVTCRGTQRVTWRQVV